MTQSNFGDGTQYEITEIKINNEDVIGIFLSISIYESIYSPVITGNIVILDSQGAGFIEQQNIEFIEPITFSFKNAKGDTLKFKGFLNGQRNEVMKDSKKFYTIDFSSEAVRKNEETRVVKQFHFTSWPDHGVPSYPTALLSFVSRVRSHLSPKDGPIISHCRYESRYSTN